MRSEGLPTAREKGRKDGRGSASFDFSSSSLFVRRTFIDRHRDVPEHSWYPYIQSSSFSTRCRGWRRSRDEVVMSDVDEQFELGRESRLRAKQRVNGEAREGFETA